MIAKNNTKARVHITGALLLALSATLPARADYQSTLVSQAPVGYWRLDGTIQPQPTAPAANLGSLGAAAAGTYTAFPTRGFPGPFADSVAVAVEGGSYVTTPWSPSLNSKPFSVEVWAKTTVVPSFGYVLSSGDMASPRGGWYLAQDNGSTFNAGSAFVVRLFNRNGTTTSAQLAAPITGPADSWYHLVLTYDGVNAALYMNGVQATNVNAGYATATNSAFTVGCRSDVNNFWRGQAAETAMYNVALTPAQVANHYAVATTTPANYVATIQADSPLVYHRYREAIDPPAPNLGTAGAAANALYMYNTQAGVPGPINPPYAGFEAGNKAASFNGGGGVVRIPALNLRTNTVTISGWIRANGPQPVGAGLVLCKSGLTDAGLVIDRVDGGLGIGYVWNGNDYGWAPNRDSGLPTLPDNDWAYVALVIKPSQAELYICDQNNYANFTSVINTYTVNHLNQDFASATVLGAESGSTTRNFNGVIDEVAIFNRALDQGELYTQYGAAVGGVPPRIFTDLQAPIDPVYVGDALVLKVDAGGTPPLSFAWRKDGSPIATTTSGTLTVEPVTASDGGAYEVTVSNGSGSILSQQASISVNPTITPTVTQLKGFVNRTLYAGGTLSMAVVGYGGGLKYQWYKDSAPIASATTSAYTVASVTNIHAGSYSLSITNTVGNISEGPVVITIPATASGSYEAIVVGHKPISWWRLNEAGGTNLWDAMGRNDGFYTSLNNSVPPVTLGATGAVNGNPDTAVTFTPSKQGVGVVPYSPSINPNVYSVEAWVKTTVTTGDIVPVSTRYSDDTMGWQWATTSGFWNGNAAPIQDNGATTAGITPGVWTHLVITYDRSRGSGGAYPYQYFVNGLGDAGYVWSGPGLNTAGPLIIGGHGVSASILANKFFDGQVDEVAVYNRLLPLSEIQSHFQGRFGATTAPYFVGTLNSQTVPTGKRVVFSTLVQGSIPLSLQWYKSGSKINGATTTTYTIASTLETDTGEYTLWATNSAGVASQSASLAVVPLVGYANVTNGQVMHLRFDGDVADSTGRGNNGTLSSPNAPVFVTGKIGSQALQYITQTDEGTTPVVTNSTYVTLGRPADLQFGATASFTISLWVKLAANYDGGDLPFIGTATNSMNNPGWALSTTYGGGGWQWGLNDGTVNVGFNGESGSISDGAWHNFVLTVDRTVKVAHGYLDGVLLAIRDITALGSLDNGGGIVIGQDPTGIYPETGGATLDDIGVWSRALTQTEVIKVYGAGNGGHSFDTIAPPITITAAKAGTNITISWEGGTLLQSDSLAPGALWTTVPGASAPSYTFPVGAGKYYKVLAE